MPQAQGYPSLKVKNARAMREEVIQMQRSFSSIPEDIKKHPDINDAIKKLFQLRSALERLMD